MDLSKLFSRPAFYIVLCVYLTVGFITLQMGDQVAAMMFDEDRYFENMGAISLFIAAGISFYTLYISWKNRRVTGIFWGRQLIYLGLALLFFVGGGEEISWGQRIFGIEQPEIMATNTQDELNVHNLAFFENSEFLKADDIFNIFWFGFAVIVPAVSLVFGWFRNLASKWMPIVHWGVGLLFLFNYAMAKAAKTLFASSYSFDLVPFVQAVQEVKESNYEFLFIFLSLFILADLLAAIRAAPAQPSTAGT
ncbi:MAG: hypothetical protein C4557_07890 [Anaerolineaceae bacterium]|nr:MAG: hypothetical protein C4557_07890 [Anaerolineaceae bacterium]